MRLARRQVLGGGLLFLGAAAVGLALRPGASGSGEVLGERAGVLEAVFEVFLPAGRASSVVAGVDAFLVGSGDPVLVSELLLGLAVLDQLGGSLGRRFSARPLAERRSVLDAWSRSSWGLKRQLSFAMRRLALFSLFADPGTWSHCGYDGPWVGR